MKRLKIGQFFGVSLGVGIASLGLYQSVSIEKPEVFQPGVTEFRSLTTYQPAANTGAAPANVLVQFNETNTDENQIALPTLEELVPSGLQLSPILQAADNGEMLPELNGQEPLNTQSITGASPIAGNSDETLEIAPPASATRVSESEDRMPKFSEMDGSSWTNNPFLDENSNSVDATTEYLEQFEVQDSFQNGNQTAEQSSDPGNLVRSRIEFVEIPAEALQIAKDAARESMIPAADAVRPSDDLDSPIVQLEGSSSFSPGSVIGPEDSVLKLAPAENREISVVPAGQPSTDFVTDHSVESIQDPIQTDTDSAYQETLARPISKTSIQHAVPVDQNFIVSSEITLTESVAQSAAHHIEYGKTLARRGATQAAQQEFFASLRVLAQARDEATNTNQYSMNLKKAILALKEAEDFMIHDTESQMGLDAGLVVETHRSRIVTADEAKTITPIRAMQRYFAIAQDQLETAVGCNVVASHTLQCLGKLSTVAAGHVSTSGRLDIAKAIVYHRAALTSDRDNFTSANELGVLLARSGQLKEAKQLIKRSLRINAMPQAWMNLAKVHARLGEQRLAELAHSEYQRTLNSSVTNNGGQIHWMSGQSFNASAPMAMHASVASKPHINTGGTKDEKPKFEEAPKSLGQRLKDLF